MVGRFLEGVEWVPIISGVVLGVVVVLAYLLLMKFLEK